MKRFDVAKIDPAVLEAVEILWKFNSIERPPVRADVILLMGSNDLSVAGVAADLALRQSGALIICSGGQAHSHDLLSTGWAGPEADMFAQALMERGIPAARILRERCARNTAENVTLSRALCPSGVKEVCVVQKPFMCLRAYLTTLRHWPGVRVGIVHEHIDFVDYLRRYGDLSLIDIIVGDTERIERYPELGYFDAVPIPEEVRSAFRQLVLRGFTGHLIEQGR